MQSFQNFRYLKKTLFPWNYLRKQMSSHFTHFVELFKSVKKLRRKKVYFPETILSITWVATNRFCPFFGFIPILSIEKRSSNFLGCYNPSALKLFGFALYIGNVLRMIRNFWKFLIFKIFIKYLNDVLWVWSVVSVCDNM